MLENALTPCNYPQLSATTRNSPELLNKAGVKRIMPTYYDSQNQPYNLTNTLGRGGEGTVYACENDFQIVAKIYHEPVDREKAQKLRWMAANRDEQLLKVAAWVIDVLTDKHDGKIVGFLMPNVRAKEIHELYSPKSRRIHFPDATWHFLIHTAANLARAFHNLHKRSHVMGDVNHGNCVVLADGTVKLIDCDSYSIKTETMRYPCEVGVTTHLAPELQGITLRGVERQTKHDNFGLAVIIFQLLFIGRHPFSGNYLGGEDKAIEDCIREHLFAYGKDASVKLVAQPPGTLSLSAVSPKVANLFERAFTKDFIRPEPREWIEALEDLADNLEQCTLHPGHLFYEKTPLCPWCEIESQTGLTLFPFVTTNSPLKSKYKKTFDIITVENLISSFNIQSNISIRHAEKLTLQNIPPVAKVVESSKDENAKKITICVIYGVGLFVFYLLIPSFCLFMLSLLVVSVLYNYYRDLGKMIRIEEKDKLINLQNKWNELEDKWVNIESSSNLTKDLTHIREQLKNYRMLKAIDLPNDDELLSIVKVTETEKSHKIEQEISGLLASVRAGSVRLRTQQQKLMSATKKLAFDLAQSNSNVKYLGNNLPIGLFLLTITILIPFISMPTKGLFSYPSPKYTYNNSGKITDKVATYPQPPPPKLLVTVPDKSITDDEIAALSVTKKAEIVRELVRLSDLNFNQKDYGNAKGKLLFALRFDKNNAELFSSIGNVNYEQKEYKRALDFFNTSKTINDNDNVNFLIGATLIRLKKYATARDIFTKLTTGSMQTYENFYNLGLAYRGLENHRAAADAYRKAIAINEYDIESRYQLGMSLNKLGDKIGVKECYRELLGRDTARAEAFKKAIGKSVNLDMPPDVIRQEDSPPATVILPRRIG